jgi:cytochrome c oxidase cbb3-type subunit 3
MSDSKLEIPERPAPGVERDGIAEEDHPIPLWFNAAWVATWVIGIAYIIWYLALSDWSSRGQWRAEVAAAAKSAPAAIAPAAGGNPYRGDAAAIADGAQTFATICSACHGPEAHGLVGPSLVDSYWKYGASDSDHFKSVMEGRPGGMPPWGPQLGAEKVWKVLAYVDSLPKTNRPEFGAPDYVAPTPPP